MDTTTTEISTKPNAAQHEPPKKWGGERTGAGRKRKYTEMPEGCGTSTRRLKCRKELSDLAYAFITILDKYHKRLEGKAMACSLDGQDLEPKGYGLRKWIEYDAIMSDFSIVLDRQSDPRLFALSFVLTRPQGVEVEAVTPQHVTLRWQRADEVARVMTRYGSILARRNRLTSEESTLLESIPQPSAPVNIPNWIDEYLCSK